MLNFIKNYLPMGIMIAIFTALVCMIFYSLSAEAQEIGIDLGNDDYIRQLRQIDRDYAPTPAAPSTSRITVVPSLEGNTTVWDQGNGMTVIKQPRRRKIVCYDMEDVIKCVRK